MNARQEYIDFLKRYVRNKNLTLAQANMEVTTREVGKSYGLTEYELSQLQFELNGSDDID
ncbi:MAG: hypothetical protein PHX08_08225 [Lachnospiraceae bacterium]|nr:hypothetical protein [Lachnospiraceae bacterium]